MLTVQSSDTETTLTDTLKNDDKLTLLLYGDGEFKPTLLMAQCVMEYIRQDSDDSPMTLLDKMGRARQNWYYWKKDYPGFSTWWNRVIEDVIKEEYLSGMYLQLLKRARTHDTGAAKLIAQRYDPKYTERSHQDIRGVFAGYEPTEAQDSRERQRKALAGPGARAVLGSNGGITGVGPVSTCFTPCIHPIAERKQREPEPGTPACNDETLDFKPVTKVDPPGGGLSG